MNILGCIYREFDKVDGFKKLDWLLVEHTRIISVIMLEKYGTFKEAR